MLQAISSCRQECFPDFRLILAEEDEGQSIQSCDEIKCLGIILKSKPLSYALGASQKVRGMLYVMKKIVYFY